MSKLENTKIKRYIKTLREVRHFLVSKSETPENPFDMASLLDCSATLEDFLEGLSIKNSIMTKSEKKKIERFLKNLDEIHDYLVSKSETPDDMQIPSIELQGVKFHLESYLPNEDRAEGISLIHPLFAVPKIEPQTQD